MYELSCPSCNAASPYDFNDYMMICPICSCTFRMHVDSGQKEIFSDHYIVSPSSNSRAVHNRVLDWFARLNHKRYPKAKGDDAGKPEGIENEFKVLNITGLIIPYWIVSMEAHTAWKGLVKRESRQRLDPLPGGNYLIESSQFKRSYRWAISSRHNICETWGLTRLHEPKEAVRVEWDGFPLDSTFSRGQLEANPNQVSAYDARQFFEAKFSNNLPVLAIQTPEEEALRRAQLHVEQYHLELARLNVDFLTDCHSEIEVAGVQLIHLPFWLVRYTYQPQNLLRHFVRPREHHVLLDGYNNGILTGELALKQKDKMWVNASVCAIATFVFLLLGVTWHPLFFMVAFFALLVAIGSAYKAMLRAEEEARVSDLVSVDGKTRILRQSAA